MLIALWIFQITSGSRNKRLKSVSVKKKSISVRAGIIAQWVNQIQPWLLATLPPTQFLAHMPKKVDDGPGTWEIWNGLLASSGSDVAVIAICGMNQHMESRRLLLFISLSLCLSNKRSFKKILSYKLASTLFKKV